MNKTAFVTGGTGFVGLNLIPLLQDNGYRVKALARSGESESKLAKLGAKPVFGHLNDEKAIAEGVAGCDIVFHLAASDNFFASEKELQLLHVEATRLLINESVKAGVSKLVYLGAASVIMNGKPIYYADESIKSDKIIDGYSKTKLEAENMVLKAHSPAFQTISLRPPLIWGNGDQNALPGIINAVNKGQMVYINGGNHRFSTCHVQNVCEALLLAGKNTLLGKAYFITDGENWVFKDFIRQYVGTQGISVPYKSVPLWFAKTIAKALEFVWKILHLTGQPPLYPGLVNTLGMEFTLSDNLARADLGYESIMSIKKGMDLMKKQP